MLTLTFNEFCSDWRAHVDKVLPGAYISIMVNIPPDMEFEIVRLSTYDENIDKDKEFIITAASIFDDTPAYFVNRVCHAQTPRVLTIRRKTKMDS